ncbi:AbrB/MazE/SpoVT family DNA-binding domain-containing protein [Methylomonas sp. MED-D]|uniref:AbrB family transcriptional regulator n=1 Tax=Methylomonas koyamae TaxID=702114 RepID=A0A177PBP5_9GAMM|nr:MULTISPECIES: AbrB/MazE/SpoVT family DNA-binding domain-containing protein [Methylomonas]MDT4331143.1 AbrB/MazE/SpoVT family DNA-binding domain-containing protein [Methylomonas sp. MV1]OAI27675.1 hypothetical protein A1355_18085 [Methylomonas koyamae]
MPKLNDKRQVTLPKAICTAIGLHPGDYIAVFARDGMVHVVKMDASEISGKILAPIQSEVCSTNENIETPGKTRVADDRLSDSNG